MHLTRSTLMLEMPTLCRVRLIEDVTLSASLRLNLILTLCVHESKASLVHRRLEAGDCFLGGLAALPVCWKMVYPPSQGEGNCHSCELEEPPWWGPRGGGSGALSGAPGCAETRICSSCDN